MTYEPETVPSRVWLEIDLAALERNFARVTAAVEPCDVFAILKANAYGLGVHPLAEALVRSRARRFGVAGLSEALELASFGLPVQILGSVLPDEIEPAVAAGVILPVSDVETARLISAAAAAQGMTARGEFLVDTGMGRLGMLVEEAPRVIRECVSLPALSMEGVYSHFPVADAAGSDYTRGQIGRFRMLLADLAAGGITFRWRHMANSDAVNNFPEAYAEPFNAVRIGINLHGSFSEEGKRVLAIESIVTLKARLVAVRRLPAGTKIGYGCTCTLPRDTLVGTISAGYADGLPMALSNRGHMLIQGKSCPVLGRVSMDYTNVSLEQVPAAACGDEVVCLGGRGPLGSTVEDWARLKDTHAYDILCSFGRRVARRYVNRPGHSQD